MMTPVSASPELAAPPVDLTWIAPSECENRDAVLGEIRRLVDASRPHDALSVRAELTRDPAGRWHVVLTLVGRPVQSQRAFDADSCAGAASAAALIVAVAFDGDTPPPKAAPTPPSAPVVKSRPSAAPSGSSELALAAGAVGEAGGLPAFAPGAEVSAGWLHGWLGGAARVRALASGSLFASQTDAIGSRPENAQFQLFAVAARGCLSFARGQVDIGPCLGAEYDAISASGVAAATFVPARGTVQWAAVLGSVLASLRLTRGVAVFARADGTAALGRPQFYLKTASGGLQFVDLPSAIAARGALGVELRFF